MNSEEIHISKVGQTKKYKKRNVQNVSTFTNIQKQYYSILMTLQYNDNWVFFQLFTIDQASFPYTMQWHRLHDIAKEASIREYIRIKKLGEDIHSTQAISFRIRFIQVGVCNLFQCAWWKVYINTLTFTQTL